ncbi:hypothetical protein NA56DRAFT_647183 [Hyaloscypha hepaticicola]|uniref:Uncharacterized protein n=1 Tax=Hyaloscypha hepaticicola TaxID=2082293 RepID=A0A2J6PZX1_9HELO|nr:hypothetical protein NA56DRAFT_647183 [Hyaloscypha hepaticicola]
MDKQPMTSKPHNSPDSTSSFQSQPRLKYFVASNLPSPQSPHSSTCHPTIRKTTPFLRTRTINILLASNLTSLLLFSNSPEIRT